LLAGFGASGGVIVSRVTVGLDSSSEMIFRIEARISSIDDSGTWFGLAMHVSAIRTRITARVGMNLSQSGRQMNRITRK
jgi:hypothetical protein